MFSAYPVHCIVHNFQRDTRAEILANKKKSHVHVLRKILITEFKKYIQWNRLHIGINMEGGRYFRRALFGAFTVSQESCPTQIIF